MTGARGQGPGAGAPGRGFLVAAGALGLALLTFFQFPGHTWLQQDTQIYAPILEHRYDPAVLANDPVAQHPHVAFTLYDEVAIGLRRATGLGFREVLEAQQVAARALGIWGLWMLAESLGLALGPAFAAAALCSLGASIAAPAVLTLEYEPSPRAIAVPLLFGAMGLAARGRWMAASLAGSAAFLYHPPSTLPFWPVFLVLAAWRRRWDILAPPVAAAALLLAAARIGGGGDTQFFARLKASEEYLQRLRAAYVWVSMWPAARILHELLLAVLAAGAWARIRAKTSKEASVLLLALAGIGLASMPVSWLLLDRMKWSLVPQIQPMRALLFVALAAQLLAAAAGLRARGLEAFAWFAVAFLIPVQAVWTEPWNLRRTAVALALAGLCAAARDFRGWRWEPAAVLGAFFVLPAAGGVVNYPNLHTPELAGLSAWARAATPRDSVFLFADAGRGLASGIFRAEALRAVYVDWKSGGQVNYLKGFGEEWWLRWRQTLARGFRPDDWPRYSELGIGYVVLQRPAPDGMRKPVFTNSRYLVYRVQ